MNINLPPDEGKKKRSIYWSTCIVLGLIGWIMFMGASVDTDPGEYNYNQLRYECDDGEYIDTLEDIENDGVEDCYDGSDEADESTGVAETCGGLMCCGSLIFAISALSTKNDNRRVVVIQKQQPQYVPVVQQVIQQPVIQQPIIRQPVVQPRQVTPNRPPPSSKAQALEWSRKARNLELARNWEDAAKAYEKAGMYSEAGRVRQENLEQSQPMVQIGQVGNTVLNDSVMITDGGQKTCPSCGKSVEASWNICPHCSSQL